MTYLTDIPLPLDVFCRANIAAALDDDTDERLAALAKYLVADHTPLPEDIAEKARRRLRRALPPANYGELCRIIRKDRK